jgi:hypothetical protein
MMTRPYAFFIATVLAALATPCVAQPIPCATPAPAPCQVVMTQLDNPRDLAFGPEGALYVAEAGRGGDGPCFFANLQTYCYGPSGAVTRLWRQEQKRVVTGLPSMAAPGTGFRAEGANGISFHGRGGGYIAIGLETDPRRRSELGEAGAYFARLVRFTPNGGWNFVADLGQFEIDNNPVGGPTRVDSNPFRVLVEPAGQLVVDAGGNDLLRVAANGEISLLATFPSKFERPVDSVPTKVVVGPDGAYYVSELSGNPFTPGAANIYRVVPGEAPSVFLSGFKTVIDIAFTENGNLYVLEHSKDTTPGIGSPGTLKRVELAGCATAPNLCPRTIVRMGLRRPTSIALGLAGEVYITVNGLDAGLGEVWRIDP